MTARAFANEILLPREHPLPDHQPHSPAHAITTTARTTHLLDAAKLAEPCRHCFSRGNCHATRLLSTTCEHNGATLTRPRKLPRGTHVFHAGEQLESIIFIRTGAVKSYLTSTTGDEYVAEFHLPGEVPGIDALFGTELHQSSAVTLEDTEVCSLPVEHLRRIVAHTPAGMRWMLELAGTKITRNHHKLILHHNMKAETRLGTFLLDLSRRYHERGYSAREFNLCMSRQDIANYLGMALETVSRQISVFQRDGLLEVDQRHVTILDFAGLAAR